MLERIRQLREGNPSATIYECRCCGTTLSPLDVEDERCPYCGPTDVVRIELR